MIDFTMHDTESAPEDAKPAMVAAQKALGFIPNQLRVMVSAPPLAQAYGFVLERFRHTTLTPLEQQVVLLAASVEDGCAYSVAAHSMLGRREGVAVDVVTAIREGKPIGDLKLEALHRLTQALIRAHGRPQPSDVDGFFAAGYGKVQMLEVILGISSKVLSNLTNELAATSLDPPLALMVWKPVH